MKVTFESLTIYPSFLSRMEFSPKGGEKKKYSELVACKKEARD